MEISEVRVKLVNASTDRLKAYCSVTIDGCFVVRDLKIIDGANGLFVAMPSRKLSSRCSSCSAKNHLRAHYCNECGTKLGDGRRPRGVRTKLHADIAHPINAECRQFVQSKVIEEFEAECERSKSPDYAGSTYDDDYEDVAEDVADGVGGSISPYEEMINELKAESSRREGGDRAVAAEAGVPSGTPDGGFLTPPESTPEEDAPEPGASDDFGMGLR